MWLVLYGGGLGVSGGSEFFRVWIVSWGEGGVCFIWHRGCG